MKLLKAILIILGIFTLIVLLLWGVFILPEYLACSKTMYEGQKGITFWGDEVDCTCENEAFIEAFFQMFSLIIALLVTVLVAVYIMYKRKKQRLNHETY